MKQTIAYGAATNQGGWPVQEDGFFANPVERVFALADGFGGRGHGDIAAKTALGAVRERGGGAPNAELFSAINKNILSWNEKRPVANRGGCSLAWLKVDKGNSVVAANCGASAVGLVRAGVCQALLAPQAAPRAAPGGALVPDQALGVSTAVVPELRGFVARAGDLIFLVSGGIDWQGPAFQAELSALWGIHMPGGSLADLAQSLVNLGPPDWNATFLGVEIL